MRNAAGPAQKGSPDSRTSEWRAQLNLRLDQLKEKKGDGPENLLLDIRSRELVRPSTRKQIAFQESSLSPKPEYHPLAERTLEKIERAKALHQEHSLEQATESAASPPVTVATPAIAKQKARKGTARTDKVERIEISLSQGTLPFVLGEATRATGSEDRIPKGVAAAPISERMMAGAIDALFIFVCCLIFLMIVFFIPEFAFFSKFSFLGLASVATLILIAYLFLFTRISACTLGMDYKSLHVVSFEGRLPSLAESGLRSFGYFISLGCFGLGFLWAIFDSERLTWHDRISRTLVVIKNSPKGSLNP